MVSPGCAGLDGVTPESGGNTYVPAGVIATQLTNVRASVEVRIGAVPARVTYTGLAPGFVGLYQINVVVPQNIQQSSGLASVQVVLNGTVFRPDGPAKLNLAVAP